MKEIFIKEDVEIVKVAEIDGVCFNRQYDLFQYDQFADKELFKKLINYLDSNEEWSHMYDKELFPDLYAFIVQFPFLSEQGLEAIIRTYIKSIHTSMGALGLLDEQFTIYGKTDEAFKSFIEIMSEKRNEYLKQHEYEMAKYGKIVKGYPDMFREPLKMILEEYKLLPSRTSILLPESELVVKDCEHISELCRYYRISFGINTDVASLMYLKQTLLGDEQLKRVPITGYIINSAIRAPLTFTREEYLKSVKAHQKKLTK